MTVVRKGWIDMGDALGDLTYDDDVFLSDTAGTLADAAGTGQSDCRHRRAGVYWEHSR